MLSQASHKPSSMSIDTIKLVSLARQANSASGGDVLPTLPPKTSSTQPKPSIQSVTRQSLGGYYKSILSVLPPGSLEKNSFDLLQEMCGRLSSDLNFITKVVNCMRVTQSPNLMMPLGDVGNIHISLSSSRKLLSIEFSASQGESSVWQVRLPRTVTL